jgi:hypothetical protein
MSFCIFLAIVFTTGVVLSTRRVGLDNWQFYAISALMACSYVMGVMS